MSLKLNLIKQRLIEIVKFDFNYLKLPLVILASFVFLGLLLANKKLKAYNLISAIYRTGWKGSFTLGVLVSRYFFTSSLRRSDLVAQAKHSIPILDNTRQFVEDPAYMLDGVVTVLKSATETEKGVIIINYSYYFLLFHKCFDIQEVADKYIVILEPSWAGFCELNILAYTDIQDPVYIMCYEERDLDFINKMKSNLIPLNVGPSWFVNYQNFKPKEVNRDIDIIMVAAWAGFKRHAAFFKAISRLKQLGFTPNIALVGYPVDMTKDEVLAFAEHYGVADWLIVYESVTHPQVCDLLNRSKVHVLWSKFEGNNRAIIEAMFCNTTVIMRKGHNYGEHYDFINEQTGCFADESDLAEHVLTIVRDYESYQPRQYVMNNRSCVLATKIMNEFIAENEVKQGRTWTQDMTVKVNELEQMDYLDLSVREQFKRDYESLLSSLKS
ncbi:glycosyltransferase [Marinifaba aquimaris]|uniref:glycosyltransferase n=1 Tax=Marinifaba aquimaris TaxID=2741323 RepID=UPI001FE390BF|nr:glycosyltransferase [Marinifaba aquimaris]